MKEMACEERPYERCEQFGASNLTDSELLAVLLRTGTRGENAPSGVVQEPSVTVELP